jgi:hypothetical protein
MQWQFVVFRKWNLFYSQNRSLEVTFLRKKIVSYDIVADSESMKKSYSLSKNLKTKERIMRIDLNAQFFSSKLICCVSLVLELQIAE